MAVNRERPAKVQGRGLPPALIELDPRHPADLALDNPGNNKWLKVSKVGARQNEAAGSVGAVGINNHFPHRLPPNESAGHLARAIEQ